MPAFDPIEFARNLAQSAKRIRLAPGVIGKSSLQNVGVLAVWAVAFWKFSPESLIFDGILFIGACLATLFIKSENKQMREFAVANPTLALMEGADITEHKKVEMEAAKGLAVIPQLISTQDPLNLSISSENKSNG